MSGGGPVNQLMSMKKGGGPTASGSKSKLGTDTVPTMLTPGEFVMSKGAVDKFGLANLMEMNKEGGGTNKPNLVSGITFGDGAGTVKNEKVWNRRNLKKGELKESDKAIDKLKKIEEAKGVRSVDVGSDLANKGGKVEKETGVKIEGLGPDTQLTALQPGEVVVTKKAAKALGIENLLKVNEALGGTNKAKKAQLGDVTLSAMAGGGRIEVQGTGNSVEGTLKMKDGSGKQIGKTYSMISGTYAGMNVPQNKRSSTRNAPIPDGTYGLSGFQQHGAYPGLPGIGHWSTYINNGSGSIGSRSGLMLHSDIGSNGTLGCVGVELGGKAGTKSEEEFLQAYKQVNPEKIKISLGSGSGDASEVDSIDSSGGSSGGSRKATEDNSEKKAANESILIDPSKPPSIQNIIHPDLMSGGTFGGSFFKNKKTPSKSPQVDTSKAVPSKGSQFALDPTQTGASSPAVFKAAQEAREKARAEGLSHEEVEKRVVAASIAAKKGQNVPQMSKSPRSNIPEAPAKKTPQVLPLPGMGGGKKQNRMNGGTHTGGGTPPVSFSSTNPAETGHRSAIKSLLGIVG